MTPWSPSRNLDQGEKYSSKGNAQLKKGNKKRAKQLYDSAIIYFNRYLEEIQDNHKAWNMTGWAYHRYGKNDKAIECLNKAIELNPKYAQPLINLGTVKESQKDYDGALEAYEKARELAPNNAWNLYRAGRLYYRVGALEKAREYLVTGQKLIDEGKWMFTNIKNKNLVKNASGLYKGARKKHPAKESRDISREVGEKINSMREKIVEGRCTYCNAEISKETNAVDKLIKNIAIAVWNVNEMLPKDAKSRNTYKYSGWSTKTDFTKDFGGYTQAITRRVWKDNLTAHSSSSVSQFYTGDFLLLEGFTCNQCADAHVKDVKKCLKKVKKNKFADKIHASMDACLKEYNKVMKKWLDKVK